MSPTAAPPRKARRNGAAAKRPAAARAGREKSPANGGKSTRASQKAEPRAAGVKAAETALAPSPELAAMAAALERYLGKALLPGVSIPPTLHAAIRYSVLSPGKRLRPMLVLAACEAVGEDWRRALPAAAAIECAHAFSLVHDDLPAMDDDDYRRGRLTTHKKYGEALGILAGDALLAFAFEALTGLTDEGVSPERVVGAVGILAAACGSTDLIGGQVLDLEAEGQRTGEAAVRAIHTRKTGGLMGASLALGALVGGASAERIEAFDEMGRDLGLAFQIHDDLLNRAGTLARTGKRPGTDDTRGKATYPRAVGDERARGEASRLFLGVLERIETLGPPASNLGLLVLAVAERER